MHVLPLFTILQFSVDSGFFPSCRKEAVKILACPL